jgi:carnitine-CoA ligase
MRMMQEFKHIGQLVKHNAKTIPNDIFLQFQEEKYTYLEVDRKSDQIALFLRRLGIDQGDHVALMLKNSPDYIFIWFGLAKLGAVMIPLNIHIKGEGLEYILNHSDAKFLIFDSEFEQEILRVKPSLTNLKHFWKREDFIKSAVNTPSTEFEMPHIEKEDPMSIIYTSGTTGLPKGVILPHFSYINTGLTFKDVVTKIMKEDILYTCLPLFHCNAQQLSVMGTLLSGAKLVLSEKFSVSNFWKEIYESKATIFNYIGSMLTILFKQPVSDYEKNNTVTRIFGGAAPKEIWEEFEKRFGLTIVEGYGLTESATVCLCNPIDQIRVGSIGKPLPHVSIKIVDENDQEVPPGVEGEIVVREEVKFTQFQGYYKMPEKTAQALKGGWFHTGDRGYQDEDGYFYFKDRIKDCIRYRGENISSYEIERIVNKHPCVKESAAIGVPSELGEEDVKVVLMLQPECDFNYEEFIRYCEQHMAYYMVPRYVEIKDHLPKTATQRVQKYALRKEGIGSSWDRVANGVQLNREIGGRR